MLGGLSVLLYHSLASMIVGESVWSMPARLAVAAFGREVYRDGLAAMVLGGMSLEVAGAGMVGAMLGLAARSAWALQRIGLLGPAVGLGWYYLGYEVLLRRFGAGSYAVAPRQSQVLAHLLFGLVLGFYPRFRRALIREGARPL